MDQVGALMMSLKYFLLLTREPSYGTYSWTLDYSKTSDFDDNVGHWQVMQHPAKQGWSRVLYSCELKLPQWVPAVMVNIFTKTALVESTTWVRKESEKRAKKMTAAEREALVALPWAVRVNPVYTQREDGGMDYRPSLGTSGSGNIGLAMAGLGAGAVEL